MVERVLTNIFTISALEVSYRPLTLVVVATALSTTEVTRSPNANASVLGTQRFRTLSPRVARTSPEVPDLARGQPPLWEA